MTSRLVLYSLLAVLVLAPAAFAASPESGDLSSKNADLTWDGGPFYLSNPATTAGLVKQVPCDVGQPACDNFRLTISINVKQVLIAIAPDAGFEGDDYDLYVYNDQGVLIASDASGDGYESVVIDPKTSSYFDVRVQPWLVTAGSTYSGVAQDVRGQQVDVVTECLEAVPENATLIDDGQPVDLTVMLLLDGTDPDRARAVMERAAASYRPLHVNLILKKMSTVTYSSTISEELISAAKETVGGKPPKGVDLVGVFTTKQMQAATGGAGTVVGQADCIGGVRWDSTSFFVVSDIPNTENPQSGTTGTLNSMGLNPNVDATAEVMAHEIGHLMGAHHHYSNCVEGNLTSAGPGDLSPCTLMHPMVNFASLNFSALSGSVVRGHASGHAAP